jgi:hypothetical protein
VKLDERTRAAAVVTVVTVLAGALTLTRLPFRWNQIALAYASYFREYRRVIDLEGWTAAFTTFVGIHPPAYSLLFLTMMESSPRTWFAVSGAFSVLAAVLLVLAARTVDRSWFVAAGAGLLLATSPHRLAYSLEPNNYPLLLVVVAASSLAFSRWERGKGGPLILLAVTVLGLWTHALFVTVPLAQALAIAPDRARRRWIWKGLGLAFLLCLPLVPAVVSAAGAAINPAPALAEVVSALFVELPARYGAAPAAWGVIALVLVGSVVPWNIDSDRGDPVVLSWLLQVLIGGAVLVVALTRGTAATWQFPYYLLLLPPLFLLAARPLGSSPFLKGLAAVALGTILVANLGWAVTESAQARAAWSRAHLTHSLVERAVQHWIPNSSLIAIHFPAYSDDDKDTVDPAFAHIPMGLPISMTDPKVPTLVGADPYWGQPVRYPDGRWLYTFTSVDPERLTAIADAVAAAEQQLIVVTWSTHVAPKELAKLEQWASERGRRPERDRSQALWMFLR